MVALVAFLAGRYPDSLAAEPNRVSLVGGLAWLSVLVAAAVVRWRARPGAALRHAAIWVALGAGLVLLYSFRHDAADLRDRFLAELVPSRGTPAAGAMTFRARENGQFAVNAMVDGVLIRFLVDTGASDVALTLSDAQRLGFDAETLVFNRPYNTANGVVYGASVRLGEVSVARSSCATSRRRSPQEI